MTRADFAARGERARHERRHVQAGSVRTPPDARVIWSPSARRFVVQRETGDTSWLGTPVFEDVGDIIPTRTSLYVAGRIGTYGTLQDAADAWLAEPDA